MTHQKSVQLIGFFQPIGRPRVLQKIVAAARYTVALVAAPAGYGKTIAIRQFLADHRPQAIEYCVRPEHDTLLGLVRGLVDSLPESLQSLRQTLAHAYASAEYDRPQRLASWLAHNLGTVSRVIFVDDVHLVCAHGECAAFLSALVTACGSAVSWIFGGRDLSALPVASWVAYGRADIPVDAAELNFTPAECHELAYSCGSTLSTHDIDMLRAVTEGWSTAVALGVKASIREREIAKANATTRGLAYAYLTEQVYGDLTEEQRAFLLDTCVFTVVDLNVLGISEVERRHMLADLRKHVTFLIDEGPDSFRYHDLFREFLIDELRGQGGGRLDRAYRKAAAALEGARHTAEAILLYARSGARDDTARLLAAHGRVMVERGQGDIVERALCVLEPLDQDAVLLDLRAAVDSLGADFAASEARYRQALAVASGDLRGEIAYRFATDLLKRGKLEALDLLREASTVESKLPLRASIHSTLATAYALHDDPKAAERHINQALVIVESGALDSSTRASILHQASYVAYQRADSKACMSYAASAAHLATKETLRTLEARIYRIQYGAATGFFDDRIKGAVLLEQMVRVTREIGDVYLTLWALAGLYDLAAERGDAEQLALLDQQIAAYEEPARREFEDELAAPRALRAAWTGDFALASGLLAGTDTGQHTVLRRALRRAEHSLYAAAAGVSPDTASLDDATNLGLDISPATPHDRRRQVQCLTYGAAGYAMLGRYARANACLRAAEQQRRAVPPRYRLLIDALRGFVLLADTNDADLFRNSTKALESEGCAGVARMLRQLPLPETKSGSNLRRLTPAEIAVLRAIAVHGTSSKAALTLGRSTNTVNVQVKSILKKLCCANRHEAIAYAREHGLVG